jgi:hypothetical protein
MPGDMADNTPGSGARRAPGFCGQWRSHQSRGNPADGRKAKSYVHRISFHRKNALLETSLPIREGCRIDRSGGRKIRAAAIAQSNSLISLAPA